MGAGLSSVPLCSRADPDSVDGNNNLHTEPDNNLQHSQLVVETQPAPVETSTPKLEREREVESEDSLESHPASHRTFGSDSGLEHSGDELELSRYVEDLDAAVDSEEEDAEEEEEGKGESESEETSESLESGDLGIDRSTTFRVSKKDEVVEQDEKVLRKLDDLESNAVSSRLSALTVRSSEMR